MPLPSPSARDGKKDPAGFLNKLQPSLGPPPQVRKPREGHRRGPAVGPLRIDRGRCVACDVHFFESHLAQAARDDLDGGSLIGTVRDHGNAGGGRWDGGWKGSWKKEVIREWRISRKN